LEELTHPLRESIYINGFEPNNPKDAIFIEDNIWRQKITVRYVPSPLYVRIGVFILTVVVAVVLFRGWRKTMSDMRGVKIRL
jgi:hypothetical protein